MNAEIASWKGQNDTEMNNDTPTTLLFREGAATI
jgi:hypothetical protein